MIKIKIIEENNILKIKEDYEPIVCRNTNYQLEFEFGEDWSKLTEKTALFIIENRKAAVDFVGNTVNIPAMPNAQNMQVFLISAESENVSLVSSTITLNLCPSTKTENIPEFEPLSNYVSTVIANVNAIKNGNIIAKVSEFAENVSNPNLLINGDFKVNQRGGATYTETGKYTVDRWKLVSGSVEVVENGIKLNGTIVQKLEHTPSMQVVASSNAGTISYSNGAVTLSTTTATLITYAKLEVGTTATPFSPRSYAEELAMCQRYYWKWKSANRNNSTYGELGFGVLSSTTVGFINISIPTTMRIIPTLKSSVEEFVIRNNETYKQVSEINVWTYNGGYVILRCTSQNEFDATWTNISLRPNNSSTAYLEFDAEIY